MATFTIRRLDDEIAEQFKQMARDHGRSTEAELRSVVEEVTRQYVEKRIRQEETGADWFLNAHETWMDGLNEDERNEPFVLPERNSASHDPFENWTEKDWHHLEGGE